MCRAEIRAQLHLLRELRAREDSDSPLRKTLRNKINELRLDYREAE